MAWRSALGRDTLVAGGLGLGADLVCQFGFERRSPDDVNHRRAAAVTAFTGAYVGLVCSYVYSLYPRLAAVVLARIPLGPAARSNPAQLRGIVSSVADNAVHVPVVYVPTYYLSVGTMQGGTLSDSVTDLREGWWDTTSTCWLFWAPFMAVNFAVIPATHRVRAVAAANFCWTIALDYITHK